MLSGPCQCVLTNVTLAISNCALPADGDNAETCWSCFNVNFNFLLKELFYASVGNKTLILDATVWTEKGKGQ